MKGKKVVSMVAIVIVAALVLSACGGNGGGGATTGGTSPDQVFTLNLSTALSETHPIAQGFARLAESVEERSEGRLILQVFPGGQLGSDDEVVEQIRQGVNNAILTDGSNMGNFVPSFGILMAPYLAESYDDMLRIVNSDTFAEWSEELAEGYNLRVLSFAWYDGLRHFMTNTPIITPDDLSGVRIRTPGSAVFQESVRAMGATPIAMPFGETYPALQQGAVDGLEVQFSAAYTASLYEVLSYINKTGHFHLQNGVVTSESWFRSLPDDLQQILMEEVARHGEETARIVQGLSDEFQAAMVAQGMTVVEPDLEAFRAAAMEVYETLELTELRDKLFAELGF